MIIGFGVFATKEFKTGEFLMEYHGSLLTQKEANALEKKHAKSNEGCFMFFFKHEGKQFW